MCVDRWHILAKIIQHVVQHCVFLNEAVTFARKTSFNNDKKGDWVHWFVFNVPATYGTWYWVYECFFDNHYYIMNRAVYEKAIISIAYIIAMWGPGVRGSPPPWGHRCRRCRRARGRPQRVPGGRAQRGGISWGGEPHKYNVKPQRKQQTWPRPNILPVFNKAQTKAH